MARLKEGNNKYFKLKFAMQLDINMCNMSVLQHVNGLNFIQDDDICWWHRVLISLRCIWLYS